MSLTHGDCLLLSVHKYNACIILLVYMKRGHYEEGQFTLEQTPKFIKYFESFYGIAYPLTKLDSVGIERMAASGMENWGLITYQ